ncbi:MAG TPA: hypothetical protein VKM93_23195 [Terriglobia bacterium]|nr:hypothetical protein [Terriglobia bacterium]
MVAIESETAAATAETTSVESPETKAPENGDRKPIPAHPQIGGRRPTRARSATSWAPGTTAIDLGGLSL